VLHPSWPISDDQRVNHGGRFTPHMTVTHIDVPFLLRSQGSPDNSRAVESIMGQSGRFQSSLELSSGF
jgi:hypothetical protein